DTAGVTRLLPEPLEPAPDGLCVATGLRVPYCTSYGAFQEAVVQVKCMFQGRAGWYCSHVWHDGPSGIAAGREIYGAQQVLTSLAGRRAGRSRVARGAMGELPVVAISSTMEEQVTPEKMPALTPSWRLKIIPRADGPGPALKQLIDCSAAVRD